MRTYPFQSVKQFFPHLGLCLLIGGPILYGVYRYDVYRDRQKLHDYVYSGQAAKDIEAMKSSKQIPDHVDGHGSR